MTRVSPRFRSAQRGFKQSHGHPRTKPPSAAYGGATTTHCPSRRRPRNHHVITDVIMSDVRTGGSA